MVPWPCSACAACVPRMRGPPEGVKGCTLVVPELVPCSASLCDARCAMRDARMRAGGDVLTARQQLGKPQPHMWGFHRCGSHASWELCVQLLPGHLSLRRQAQCAWQHACRCAARRSH
eukprot:6209377-Pleurochrysis_carterae.AAC.2